MNPQIKLLACINFPANMKTETFEFTKGILTLSCLPSSLSDPYASERQHFACWIRGRSNVSGNYVNTSLNYAQVPRKLNNSISLPIAGFLGRSKGPLLQRANNESSRGLEMKTGAHLQGWGLSSELRHLLPSSKMNLATDQSKHGQSISGKETRVN